MAAFAGEVSLFEAFHYVGRAFLVSLVGPVPPATESMARPPSAVRSLKRPVKPALQNFATATPPHDAAVKAAYPAAAD